MECRHAYLKKDIDYLLCDKEPEPSRADRAKLFHAVCAHQAHCPKKNCHKLTADWARCVKLAEGNSKAYEQIFSEPDPAAEEVQKPATKSRKKTKPEE